MADLIRERPAPKTPMHIYSLATGKALCEADDDPLVATIFIDRAECERCKELLK